MPNSNDAATKRATPARSTRYFFDDELAIFRVEDTLYRVHRHFLARHSEVFRDMFSCPFGEGTRDGESEDAPIELPGVKAQEMDVLLDFFYETTRPREFSFVEAVNLLSIATRYMFDEVREAALEELAVLRHTVPPVQRIVVAREHPHMHDWLKPAFLDLCVSAEPLTVREAKQLGLEMATHVAYIREKCRGRYMLTVGDSNLREYAEETLRGLPGIV